jgi:hypothetical protein
MKWVAWWRSTSSVQRLRSAPFQAPNRGYWHEPDGLGRLVRARFRKALKTFAPREMSPV